MAVDSSYLGKKKKTQDESVKENLVGAGGLVFGFKGPENMDN